METPNSTTAMPPALVLTPLNDSLRRILGRPCFRCVEIAALLRSEGQQIDHNAEAEQAAVIYWLLTKYAEHGEDWWRVAYDELQAIAMRVLHKPEPA
jgi:hypothetical protein